MVEKSGVSVTASRSGSRISFPVHRIALIAMWLVTTVTLVVMLVGGVRDTGRFRVERDILQAAYVMALLWYLFREGPPVRELPEVGPLLLRKRRIGKLVPALVIAFLFVTELLGQGLLLLLLMPAALWVLIAGRREIRLASIPVGLGVTALAFLGGLPFWQNQAIERTVMIAFLAFVTPMFVAGGMLSRRTGLGGSQLYAGRYREAALSLLRGLVLYVPLGLTNAGSGAPEMSMPWVTRWSIPLTLPWFSGIVEEAWWRLFVVSLAYVMLRPAFRRRPAIAVACAVLFSAIPFGLGHGGTLLDRLLMTGLLYGLPMAVTFAKRDWEHAVGAHFMINMIPTLMLFLEG